MVGLGSSVSKRNTDSPSRKKKHSGSEDSKSGSKSRSRSRSRSKSSASVAKKRKVRKKKTTACKGPVARKTKIAVRKTQAKRAKDKIKASGISRLLVSGHQVTTSSTFSQVSHCKNVQTQTILEGEFLSVSNYIKKEVDKAIRVFEDQYEKFIAEVLKSSEDSMYKFRSSIQKFLTRGEKHTETGCVENLHKELVGDSASLDIKDKAVLVLCELLLGENILQEVKTPRRENTAEDDSCQNPNSKAVDKKKASSTTVAEICAINVDVEKTLEERLDLFYEFAKKQLKTNEYVDRFYNELLREAERLHVKDRAVLLLCMLLLGENIMQEVEQHRLLFFKFTHEQQKAQRYLLRGLEQVINLHRDTLMSKVPHILKLFYDADILEEEVLIEWGQKVSEKYVSKEVAHEIHDKARPFIKWLQEAEEEESSSDEEEEEAV